MKPMFIILLVLLATACGGRSSVASKSAEAYRDAQENDTALGGGGHDHGGHEAGTATTATVDHSAHEMPADAHAGHDAMGSGHGAAAASDAHAAHRAATDPGAHAAMGRTEHAAMSDAHAQHTTPSTDHSAHGATPARTPGHAKHFTPLERTGPDPHHPAARIATPPQVPAAPRSNAEMRNLQPSSTLQPDAFDAPAPVSVSEAAKARAGGTDSGAHDPKKH